MLKELATLSIGMLFLGGHVTNLETLRSLAHDDGSECAAQPSQASPRRPRNGGAEKLALALIWLLTPGLLLVSAANLLHMV